MGVRSTNATTARPADEDAHLAHAVFHGLAGRRVGGQAGGVGRALARALEAGRARRAPGQHVAVRVGDRDDGVVEAGLDVGVAARDVLALAAANPPGARAARCATFSHTRLLLRRGLLAAGDRLLGSLAHAGVGARPLAMHGQAAAVAHTAIAADLHQPLDVQVDLA